MEFSRPEYWSGQPFHFPGDLPNAGIESRSPTLQADSLPAEPQGKPLTQIRCFKTWFICNSSCYILQTLTSEVGPLFYYYQLKILRTCLNVSILNREIVVIIGVLCPQHKAQCQAHSTWFKNISLVIELNGSLFYFLFILKSFLEHNWFTLLCQLRCIAR